MINILVNSGFDSLHLYENFRVLGSQALDQLAGGLNWMIENEPAGVLIGGTAVVSYLDGGRMLTPDIDFMVRDIDKIKSLLEETGLRFDPLIDDLGITVAALNIDILSSGSGNPALNELIMKTPLVQKIGGVGVRVINPELLFIMKMELGRDKDTDDAMLLLQSGVLRKSKFLGYMSDMGSNLNDPESLQIYSGMMG
jgi:hypothetical protein